MASWSLSEAWGCKKHLHDLATKMLDSRLGPWHSSGWPERHGAWNQQIMSHVPAAKQVEVDLNLQAFLLLEKDLVGMYAGKHVLMRHERVIDAYDSALAAQRAGEQLYSDGIFSIQEVCSKVGDLGFYSHAMYLWRP